METGFTEVLTEQHYDNYTGLTGQLSTPSGSATQGLPTWSKTKVIGTESSGNQWVTTVTGYDDKGRVNHSGVNNPALDFKETQSHELDFVGRITQTTTNHTKSVNTITILDAFTYDAAGRLLTHKQTLDGKTETLSTHCYNALGQQERKTLGDGLQTLDHDYNLRGWLTSTNAPEDLKQDLFGFELDYLPNGNIQKMEWNHKGEEAQNYSYTYDALNRIKTATHSSGNYNVSGITYDKNGNIQTLNRQGYLGSGFGAMDALDYAYTGNQLTKVTDSGNTAYGFKASSSSYGYDVNGNMTSDSGKGIGITYNHLNLPETVTKGSENIVYLYDASGVKLKKTVGSHTTAYTGTAVYKDGKLEFINHAEGYIEKDGTGYKYVYRLTDHLGNTRVSFKNKNADKTITGDEVIETSDYYPFGLEHKKQNNQVTASNLGQNYKFGGKELSEDLGLDTYDFGARNYQADLGRWMNIDPLAEQMRRHSPYNYAFDNPIYFIDPDGMMPIGVGSMYDEKNFYPNNTDSPNYIASTVVNNEGEIIDYRDDGDDNIYLNVRSEENIIGKESEGSEYIVGQTIYGGDIFDDAELPDNFYVAINRNGPNQNKVNLIEGAGLLEFVGPAGILKWKSVLNLLRSLTFKNGTKWVFGTFKSKAKWASQLTKRGWTKKQITEAVRKGQQIKAVNNVNKGNTATRYVHPTTGKSVVVDDVTKEVLHVGGAGFKY